MHQPRLFSQLTDEAQSSRHPYDPNCLRTQGSCTILHRIYAAILFCRIFPKIPFEEITKSNHHFGLLFYILLKVNRKVPVAFRYTNGLSFCPFTVTVNVASSLMSMNLYPWTSSEGLAGPGRRSISEMHFSFEFFSSFLIFTTSSLKAFFLDLWLLTVSIPTTGSL